MKKVYFKSFHGLQKAQRINVRDGYSCKLGMYNCKHGPTLGYSVYSSYSRRELNHLILCDKCNSSVPFQYKGD
jgi:hypothetical protein